MDFEQILNNIVNWLTTSGVKILLGLIVLWVVFKVINRVSRRFEKGMHKKQVDITIASVTISTVRKALKILAVICFIGYIGIETSSIAAALASAGVAIGLAMQGSLSNIAGGFVILIMRPYKIGDYVMIGGEEGSVEKVELFYTYLTTTDNKVVIIPNANASNDTIINYCQKDTRRVDLVFEVAYESDVEKAKQVIEDCAKATGLLLEGTPVFVRVSGHAKSGIEIKAKLWVKTGDYWPMHHAMLENVLVELEKAGIDIPYDKLEVTLKQ